MKKSCVFFNSVSAVCHHQIVFRLTGETEGKDFVWFFKLMSKRKKRKQSVLCYASVLLRIQTKWCMRVTISVCVCECVRGAYRNTEILLIQTVTSYQPFTTVAMSLLPQTWKTMKHQVKGHIFPVHCSCCLCVPAVKRKRKGWYCEVIFTGSTAAVRWACAYLLRGQSEEVLKIRPKSFLMHQQQPKHKHLRIKHCHTQADLLEQHLQLYSNNIGREELLFWSGT